MRIGTSQLEIEVVTLWEKWCAAKKQILRTPCWFWNRDCRKPVIKSVSRRGMGMERHQLQTLRCWMYWTLLGEGMGCRTILHEKCEGVLGRSLLWRKRLYSITRKGSDCKARNWGIKAGVRDLWEGVGWGQERVQKVEPKTTFQTMWPCLRDSVTLGRTMEWQEIGLVSLPVLLFVFRQGQLLTLIDQGLTKACPRSREAVPTYEVKRSGLSRGSEVSDAGRK